MPTYIYACKKCNKEYDKFMSIKELETDPKFECDECKESLVRQVTSSGVKHSSWGFWKP